MENRQTRILEIVAKHQRAEVSSLSELLGVSQVTIRKDLDRLEKKGFIRRSHGYATLDGADDVGKNMAYNYTIKRQIARAAAETVEEGETVMIESGSCCALLAEELASAKKDVTIITNSIFIANYIRHAAQTRVILLGGYYQPNAQVVAGPMTIKCGEIFFSDKFFTGTDGFMPNFGFTGKDHLRVQTVSNLAERAREVIILTDAEKFRRQGVLGMMRLDRVTDVYTDESIPHEAEAELRENNVAVHKVAEYSA